MPMTSAGKRRAKREGKGITGTAAGDEEPQDPQGPSATEQATTQTSIPHQIPEATETIATQPKGPLTYLKLDLEDVSRRLPAYLRQTTQYSAHSTSSLLHHFSLKMEIQNYRKFNKLTNEEQYIIPTALVQRKGFNNQGEPINIQVNSYKIQTWPTKKVHQYDVLVGSGTEKRALIKKVWYSKTVKQHLGVGAGWLFDGNKLAWSQQDLPMGPTKEVVIKVDLDLEEGIIPREGRENRFRVVIRKTGIVDLSAIRGYLEGTIEFNNAVLQGINFLDHLMRETPGSKYTTVKQSFFKKGQERKVLGGGVEAFKGVYQSIRPTQGKSLTVNVDVSNGVFWTNSTLDICAKNLIGCNLNKLYRIEGFTPHNVTALTFRFDVREKATGKVLETNVKDYFLRKYQISLRHPDLPLVKAGRSGMFPMELCTIAENQRYPFKLGPEQTSAMIRHAVTKPPVRMGHIKEGIKMLDWANDPVLKQYGMTISPEMTTTNARLIQEPVIQFGGSGKAATISGTVHFGKWNIKDRKFLHSNPVPLRSWGVMIFATPQTAPRAAIIAWVNEFKRVYGTHGGDIVMKEPPLVYANKDLDIDKNLNEVYQRACKAVQIRCQIILVIVETKAAWLYLRIKRTMDTYFGVVSQCCQLSHVLGMKPDYCSNVAMKFNAKLGGTTSKIAGSITPDGQFPAPTIVIGADVSHGAAGQVQASTAAITVSLDRYASRYGAICNTNGVKLEMITTENIQRATIKLTRRWIETHKIYPRNVYYFRDGVSEGQYQQVLDQEVRDMKAGFKKTWPSWNASKPRS
ncbi:hypothetical protein FGG08_005919 [Glutinoglossum americanum]|uniref:Piwi-domain-containing protein n=1 Tax=Glutinoglossum americanum TaxID=1670608 RepID=A0A9P8HZD0_9PEZI|nr:hypothetical protein FGG08_005919 [Glutinoglossum americanum]